MLCLLLTGDMKEFGLGGLGLRWGDVSVAGVLVMTVLKRLLSSFLLLMIS